MLRAQLLAKMAEQTERSADEIDAAAVEHPDATVLTLGLTSAMGIALKGWVFHELEAELTTFELLKVPFDQVVLAIEAARRQDMGAKLPEISTASAPYVPPPSVPSPAGAGA